MNDNNTPEQSQDPAGTIWGRSIETGDPVYIGKFFRGRRDSGKVSPPSLMRLLAQSRREPTDPMPSSLPEDVPISDINLFDPSLGEGVSSEPRSLFSLMSRRLVVPLYEFQEQVDHEERYAKWQSEIFRRAFASMEAEGGSNVFRPSNSTVRPRFSLQGLESAPYVARVLPGLGKSRYAAAYVHAMLAIQDSEQTLGDILDRGGNEMEFPVDKVQVEKAVREALPASGFKRIPVPPSIHP